MLNHSDLTLGVELEFVKFTPKKPLAAQFHTKLQHLNRNLKVQAVVDLLGSQIEKVTVRLAQGDNAYHTPTLKRLPEFTRNGQTFEMTIPENGQLPSHWAEIDENWRDFMWTYNHPQSALKQVRSMLETANLEWEIDQDESLTGWGYDAFEVRSPILGVDDLNQVDDVYTALNGNVNTDKSCGVHIHVGRSNRWTLEDLKKLVNYWVANEDEIFRNPIVRNSSASRPIAKKIDLERLHRVEHVGSIHREIATGKGCALNLGSLFQHDTVEFRCFSGTTDANRVREYVGFVIEILENALA